MACQHGRHDRDLARDAVQRVPARADRYYRQRAGPSTASRSTSSLPQGSSYRVTALVRAEAPEGITANELAAAGTVYPEWARQFIAIEPGSIGPIVKQQADAIVAALPASERDPYHEAKALQDWLYSGGGFIYDTDVEGACAPGTPVPDCLLVSKRGYCEYFATTLVMMLRTQEIPPAMSLGTCLASGARREF